MLAMILGPDGLIVIVVAAVVLLFGGAKLPQLARGLGSASHEFKKGIAEGDPSAAALKSPEQSATAPAPAAESGRPPA